MAEASYARREDAPARVYPWTVLTRGFGLASDPKKLVLGALGLVFLNAGWGALDRAFPRSRTITPEVWRPFEAVDFTSLERFASELVSAPLRLSEPARFVLGPFVAAFSVGSDGWTLLHAFLAGTWSVIVWGLIGGAISRMALVQVASGERTSLSSALRFAFSKVVPLVVGPLSPMLAVALFAALCAGFGILYRFPGRIGPVVAGVLLFLPMLGGLLMTLILTGLAAGWPLIHASVAAEAEDGFDALSRSYAYVHQRAGHYAAYVAFSWLIGIAGYVLIEVFARLVLHFTQWGLSFSAPRGTLGGLFVTEAVAVDPVAATVHAFWLFLVRLLVHGWIYSYFWTSASLLYLLLRRDVDGTPWNHVVVSEGHDDSLLPGVEASGTSSTEPGPTAPSG